MFKYTIRFISDFRFWCQKSKLLRREYIELECIEDEEWLHSISGFGYCQLMQRNRAERKHLHEE